MHTKTTCTSRGVNKISLSVFLLFCNGFLRYSNDRLNFLSPRTQSLDEEQRSLSEEMKDKLIYISQVGVKNGHFLNLQRITYDLQRFAWGTAI